MSKIGWFLICLVIISFSLGAKTPLVYASCSTLKVGPSTIPANFDDKITLTSESPCFLKDFNYTIIFHPQGLSLKNLNDAGDFAIAWQKTDPEDVERIIKPSVDLTTVSTGNISRGKKHPGTWLIEVCGIEKAGRPSDCEGKIIAQGSFKVDATTPAPPPPAPPPPANLPVIDITTQTQCKFPKGVPVTINKINNVIVKQGYQWWWHGDLSPKSLPEENLIYDAFASTLTLTIPASETSQTGDRTFCINRTGSFTNLQNNCITLTFLSYQPDPNKEDISCDPATRGPRVKGGGGTSPSCINGKDSSGNSCTTGGGEQVPGCGIPDVNGVPDPRGPGIVTAIGCIHTNPVEFTKDLMKFIIGISGGLAFLMMLLGAFQILSSADNPDTLKAGRERLTNAVIGLLIVIFAILLLQIIGVGILDIPGFGK